MKLENVFVNYPEFVKKSVMLDDNNGFKNNYNPTTPSTNN